MLASAYVTSIRRQLGLSDTDTVVSDAVVLWALNGALKTISTDKDWPWLYVEASTNTVSGTSNYALPARFTRAAFITVDSGPPIAAKSLIDLAWDRSTTGVPYAYVVEDNETRLYPTPDGVYPIVYAYYQSEPELTASDSPLLPDAYSEWLVYEAAIKLAIRTNNLERLTTLRDESEKIHKGILDNYRRSHDPPGIRRTRAASWPSNW